jgi:hypothetical protein
LAPADFNCPVAFVLMERFIDHPTPIGFGVTHPQKNNPFAFTRGANLVGRTQSVHNTLLFASFTRTIILLT